MNSNSSCKISKLNPSVLDTDGSFSFLSLKADLLIDMKLLTKILCSLFLLSQLVLSGCSDPPPLDDVPPEEDPALMDDTVEPDNSKEIDPATM